MPHPPLSQGPESPTQQPGDADSQSHALYEAARKLMDAGRIEEAVETFERSARLSPHFKTLELLGECLIGLGRPREAIIPLAAATALNKQVRAPSLLAQLLLQLGAHDDARRFAELVLSSAPSNRQALEVLHALSKITAGA